MEETQNTSTNDSTEERLRRLKKARADFFAEMEMIKIEQKKLNEKVRQLLEKAQVKKVLEKIVSIK